MIKSYLIAGIGSLVVGTSFGQSLSASDVNPVVGDMFDYVQSSYASPGNSGAGQTWDFSTVTQSTTGNINFIASNGTFPQANIIQDDPSGGQIHQDVSNSGMYIWGIESGGIPITYSDAMTYLEYPLAVGNSGNDTHLATFNSGGIDFTRAGTSTWNTDGSGTVITPQGTFTDVVRVHITQDYTDTFQGGTIDYDVDIYVWLKAGIHYPVASMTEFTTIQGTQQYGTYLTGNVELLENTASPISVFPNPASDNLHVNGEKEIDQLVLYDLSGNIVTTSASTSMDISGLDSGVYLMVAVYSDGKKSKAVKTVKM
ncbi:MAG: T9SS type A sorting domain-containing protein [bacterium]|nr:T9SS type A sorting domain-containing protein [bacterium]